MSASVYAGSMQFVAVSFFQPGIGLLHVIVMTLLVNVRHVFYGISMLEPFRNLGKKKLYLVFSLTDETYSLLCSAKVPQGIDKGWFFFFIALLNQIYWIAGSVLGGAVGTLIPFDMTGIDFAMTALFAVILTEQWLNAKDHTPVLIGMGASVICLVIFGPSNFILPSMILMAAALMTVQRRKEGERQNDA